MCRNAAESESWEDTLSGDEQLLLNWENYWFNAEEQLVRRNLVVEAMIARMCWEHWSMLRGDAEAESWRLQLSGQEQQQMTNEIKQMRVAENYTYQMHQEESYHAVFGDVEDSDAEEMVAAAPLLAPTQSKHPSPLVPRQPLHPPPPAPPKHGRPGGPNCMFIPADGDAAGHALRYYKDRHNERERNRKARRALEKVASTTMSKAGTMSSASSSSTWIRPLLNPPPPPPAKRSA